MSLTRRALLGGRTARKNLTGNVLVCVFQRGAADGLNSVVPWRDADYYALRPRIAVPPPGDGDGAAIDLDGFFGLHPQLAPLLPLYTEGRLALLHATGVPHGSRSHFDAQALVEAGATDDAGLDAGWLGRHLAATAAEDDSLFRAVAIAGAVPGSLRGARDPLAIGDLDSFGLGELGGSHYQDTLALLYADGRPYADPAQAALAASDALAAADPGQYGPENGADYPAGELGGRLLQAAQLIKAELGIEVICADVGGWDHHESENSFLPTALDGLARALLAFDTDLGARMAQVTVLVITEFGRRAADNVSAGTDHGTAGCAYLLGGGVAGAQVAGVWPGLAPAALAGGQDLAITTDLRQVLAQMLARLGNPDPASAFPGFVPDPQAPLLIR